MYNVFIHITYKFILNNQCHPTKCYYIHYIYILCGMQNFIFIVFLVVLIYTEKSLHYTYIQYNIHIYRKYC